MGGAENKAGANVATIDSPLGEGGLSAGNRAYKAQLGRFVILHQLGAGGMGAVLAAYDEQLDRKVALKLLHSQGATRERQHRRTLREAKALARVTHPRVVSVYEVGEAENQVYLAMEFVDGISLRIWQSQAMRSWRDILYMYLQAGEGLHAVHKAGIVHRDFKPENVIVGKDGLPRVADFGIARLNELQTAEDVAGSGPQALQTELVTLEGGLIGTIGYISPEQYEGTTSDEISDQWSFCAALYEALYGCLPFAGSTAAEQSVSIRGPIQPPPADSAVPPEIFRILSQGLSYEPSARFPNLTALLRSLTAEYEQSPAAATQSRRTLVAVVATTCISVFLLAQYLLIYRNRMVPQAALMTLGLIMATLAVGYRHRATLRRNPFHRAMWSLFLVTFIQNFCIRAIFTVRSQLPPGVEVGMEMIVWGGTSLTIALTLMRRMWWVTAIPLCVGSLAIIIEPAPRRILLCAYPIIVGLVLWHWLAAARESSHKDGNSSRAS